MQNEMNRSILILSAALAIAVGLVQEAGAASAPTAATGSASSVTSSSATVSGTVNPAGQSTTYSFQYGTTTAYGSQTSAQSAGQDTTDHAVSASLTGLKPARTYHYRVSATNGSGTTVGADMTFTTAPRPPPPPAPIATTGRASHITSTGATVAGTVSPNGSKTTYYVEFGLIPYGLQTGSKSLAAGSPPAAVSVKLHGLAAGRVYHYRLVAKNAGGTSRGADLTFTTAAARQKRVLPKVTATTTPRRDRKRRLRFTIRGRVIPPNGVSASRACRGKLTVRFRDGRKTIILRQLRLSRSCRYSARVNLSAKRHLRSRLRVTVHFLGSPLLKPRWARSQVVRIG
jgi:ribosomal protein S6E (S10)